MGDSAQPQKEACWPGILEARAEREEKLFPTEGEEQAQGTTGERGKGLGKTG